MEVSHTGSAKLTLRNGDQHTVKVAFIVKNKKGYGSIWGPHAYMQGVQAELEIGGFALPITFTAADATGPSSFILSGSARPLS